MKLHTLKAALHSSTWCAQNAYHSTNLSPRVAKLRSAGHIQPSTSCIRPV